MSAQRKYTTARQMDAILDEYFSNTVTNGWQFAVHGNKADNKVTFELRVRFYLYLDKDAGQTSINIRFLTNITEGQPQSEWETEWRELLQRISSKFTGDIEETLIGLQQVSTQYSRNNVNLDAFRQKIAELPLKRYREYAKRVSWDTWEVLMMKQGFA